MTMTKLVSHVAQLLHLSGHLESSLESTNTDLGRWTLHVEPESPAACNILRWKITDLVGVLPLQLLRLSCVCL